MKILIDRKDLYGLELPLPEMKPVLEVFMRRYEGIFSFAVFIDEDYVAERCGIGVPRLREVMYRLSLEHIIKYIPSDRSDVLLLCHDRLAPGNLMLSTSLYERLKSVGKARVEAMVEYAEQSERCRSRWLLSYFGQEDSSDCRNCDVCRRRRADTNSLRERLTVYLSSRGGACSPKEIRDAFPDSSDLALELFRQMVDEGLCRVI